MNCANAPCETCQWKDTCERYLEWLDMVVFFDYEEAGEWYDE